MSKSGRAKKKKKPSILDRPYSRILIPQEDGRFQAEILEFPGCFAEGDSPEVAYRNLEAAAGAWVSGCLESGLPVPEPIANYDISGKFALRLPRSLYARASKMAAKENVSLNQFVVTAVAEKMGSCSTAGVLTGHLTRELGRSLRCVMPTPKQVVFKFPELAELMVRKSGIQEGHWGIFVRFGLQATNISTSGDSLKPAAIVPIVEIGIQQFDAPNSLTVDAAEISAEK